MSALALALWLASQQPAPLLATFYGQEFQGRHTASGQLYDVNGMTAAHRTLPFGTRVKVCAVRSRRCVRVVINDRFALKTRAGELSAIDLTPRAFAKLASVKAGTVRVTIQRLGGE